MPFFETMFRGNRIIEYKGETLYRADHISVEPVFKVRVRLISTNSEWKQFINLSVNKGGYLLAENTGAQGFRLHEDTMPPEVELIGQSKDGILHVWNGWIEPPAWTEPHYQDGYRNIRILESPMSCVRGAAMKKEIRGDTLRYYCNDGHPDEDFDDIIFELTVLPVEQDIVFPKNPLFLQRLNEVLQGLSKELKPHGFQKLGHGFRRVVDGDLCQVIRFEEDGNDCFSVYIYEYIPEAEEETVTPEPIKPRTLYRSRHFELRFDRESPQNYPLFIGGENAYIQRFTMILREEILPIFDDLDTRDKVLENRKKYRDREYCPRFAQKDAEFILARRKAEGS